MLTSVLRTVLLYCIIITAIRIMGKRQISDLQTSELVVTLLISDIAAIPMENTSQPLLSGFVPILILVACEILLSVIMIKKSGFRRLICGKPIVVISKGEIQQSQLKRLRMTTEDLFEQLRQNEVFSLDDVEFAIIETNGKMSVMKNPKKEPPNCEDLNITPSDKGIEAVVVSDGNISRFSCMLCGIESKAIYNELKKQNIKLKDVFIMTADQSGNFKIIKGEKEK